MNKLLLTWGLLWAAMAPAAWGQVEFAPVGATYYYSGGYEINNEPTIVPYTFTMQVLADTVVAGQACRKLNGGQQWRCDADTDGMTYAYSADRRVYWWNGGTGNFELLYDFGKGAGESWQVPRYCPTLDGGCPLDSFTVQVDSVSYLPLENTIIQVQHVRVESDQAGGTFRIYEGIGCAEFFFFFREESFCTTAHDYLLGLRCFDSPVDGLLTFFTDAGTCDQVVGVDDALDVPNAVRVFPNPTADAVTVVAVGKLDVELFDLQGKRIAAVVGADGAATLHLGEVPAGVYVLRARHGGRVWMQKVVKAGR